MRILIVEDEDMSARYLNLLMSKFGKCDLSVDGINALKKFKDALEEEEPYNLVLMDIMMPNLDGQSALKELRQIEAEKNIIGTDRCKVIMTTALSGISHIKQSFRSQADGYIVKPVKKEKILEELRKLNLIPSKSN